MAGGQIYENLGQGKVWIALIGTNGTPIAAPVVDAAPGATYTELTAGGYTDDNGVTLTQAQSVTLMRAGNTPNPRQGRRNEATQTLTFSVSDTRIDIWARINEAIASTTTSPAGEQVISDLDFEMDEYSLVFRPNSPVAIGKSLQLYVPRCIDSTPGRSLGFHRNDPVGVEFEFTFLTQSQDVTQTYIVQAANAG